MFTPKPGDIILVRGRRFRSKLARFCMRNYWNHMFLYWGGGMCIELTHEGLEFPKFTNFVDKKSSMVLRLLNLNTNDAGLKITSIMEGIASLEIHLDWLRYLALWLCLPISETFASARRNNGYWLCTELVEEFYKKIGEEIETNVLLHNRYMDYYPFQVVYDYRETI